MREVLDTLISTKLKLSIKNVRISRETAAPAAFLLTALFAVWWLSGAADAFSSLFAFLAYSALFFLLRAAYGAAFSRGIPSFREFFPSFVRVTGRGFALVFAAIATFAVYENEIAPAELPAYVLSNGEKTVVFRPMAHIASPRYYAEVKRELSEARNGGYALFYEGVRPGTPENTARFNALLGLEFSKELYPAMSKLYGLVPQDTRAIVGEFAEGDVNADVSIDDIIAAYDRKFGSGASDSKPKSESPSGIRDVAKDFSEYADSLSSRELALIRYVNRGIMSFVIKNRGAADAVAEGAGNADLFSVILHDRNEVIAREILSSDRSKIYATYGLLHFDGVFDLLQEADPKWKVTISDRKLYPTVP